MISPRGPENILVVDRTGISVLDICMSILHSGTFENITKKMPVNKEEIVECINTFCDHIAKSEHDFIEIECKKEGDLIHVETVGLSDWVFISALQIGLELEPEEQDINTVYAAGIESIFVDCLVDEYKDVEHYKFSDIHKLVMDGFTTAFGKVERDDVITMLLSLGVDLEELD